MKIFFGGIIQGSNQGREIFSQDYREKIKTILKEKYPDIMVFDPFENHNNSVDYSDDQARDTFFNHLEMIKSSDLMIAYLPKASMGTAIEIWQAYHDQVPVLTISPMTTNWIIRLFSEKNFETAEDFERFIRKNDLIKLFSPERKQAGIIEESA